MAVLSVHPGCNPECRVCHYKDLEYGNQLQKKQNWASSQLGRFEGLREIIPAPEGERASYRAKSWMRAHSEEGKLSFGMQKSVRQDGKWEKKFIAWDSCPMHVPGIQGMIAKLRAELVSFRHLVGVWFGPPHLVVVVDGPIESELSRLDWASILEPPFQNAWMHLNAQVGKNVFGHRGFVPLLSRPREPELREPPVQAFRQVSGSLLAQARAQAVEALLESQPRMILDLYSGTGELSLLIPPSVGWLGIELSIHASRYAETLRLPSESVHAAFVGAVEQRLRHREVREKVVSPYSLYLNPPRSGLSADASAEISKWIREKRPETVVYLSCSASSLARDLGAFEELGFVPELLQPYDFFPQTEHFETLAILKNVSI